MRTFTAVLESRSAYSQSRRHDLPKLNKESDTAYDARTWRDHCTVNKDGIVCIPAMAFKKAIDRTAQKLGEKVPGRRGATWAGYFKGGIIPMEELFPIGIKVEDVQPLSVWCSSTGRPGGSQVSRTYPIIPKWTATVEFEVLDNILPEEVIERTLSESGLIVGIGRFRPENGGFNGRYAVKSVKWSNGL